MTKWVQGLSARVLQRLPLQSLAMYVAWEPSSIEEAIDALGRMVKEKLLLIKSEAQDYVSL